ncbi:hypothetical protein [Pectinatus frisingensis]|uniref:hypothetical protein n=1 Tax=Pectinatus frisingensis TaxID=865 RepID=UPI0018C74F0E|nr:hypothetical protein [Pectinatus frisingensis]
MVEINVKDVEIGASYEGEIYDFWVKGELVSGQLIKIFDCIPFNLSNCVGKSLDVLLLAGFIKLGIKREETHKTTISGNFIREYEIPRNIVKIRKDVYQKKWFGFQNNDGIFLLDPAEFENIDLKYGEGVSINVGRFDLIGIV